VNTALNVRDYACGKVRRRLDSFLAGELSVDLSHEILEHLDRCATCSSELRARESLRASVRRIAAAAPEPRAGFEAEVRARIARTPAPSAGPVSTLLLAASLVAAAGVGILLVVSHAATSPKTNLAAARDAKAFLFAALNHENCALRFDAWTKAPAVSPAEIGPRLDPELKAAAAGAAARLPGFEAVTAHECNHAGEKVFHLIYRRRGSASPHDLVSVVATRPGSTRAAGVRLAGIVSGGDRDGLAVVGTSAPDGRLVFLVTDGNDAEARRLGTLVLPVLAAAFAPR
jgi:anti-sigma factor RsiW